MMSAEALYLSLMEAAAAVPLDYPIAWEDVPFQKPVSAPWLRVQHLPVSSGLRNSGILQIDIYRPSGAGAAGLLADVVAVVDHFSDRRTFPGFYVHHHSLSALLPDDGWSVMSVSIYYRSAL